MAKSSRSKALKNKSPFARDTPPKVVTILGKKIKVTLHDTLELNGVELLGAFSPEEKRIYLKKNLPNWRDIFFHECLHAAWHFSAANEGLTMETEERLILALEHAMCPLLFKDF